MANKRKGFTSAAALKCLGVGIIGSILIVASYITLQLVWLGLITYNEGLRNVFLGQMALLILLAPVLIGFAAAWSVSSLKLRYNGSVLAGLISGITGGPGFSIALSVLVMTWNIARHNLLEWKAVHDMVFPVLTTGMLSLLDDILFVVLFILLAMMLSAIGGGIYFIVSYYSGKGKKKQSPKKTGMNPIVYAAAVFLIVLIVPVAAAYAGNAAGLIKSEGFVYPVDVQRTADDTITFTNNGLDRVADLETGYPLIVYLNVGGINFKDITNQSTATKELVAVNLTPASGLGFTKGASLTVKGPDIIKYAYKDEATGKPVVRILVIGTTTGGDEIILREVSV